jgi:hypothetical protein
VSSPPNHIVAFKSTALDSVMGSAHSHLNWPSELEKIEAKTERQGHPPIKRTLGNSMRLRINECDSHLMPVQNEIRLVQVPTPFFAMCKWGMDYDSK